VRSSLDIVHDGDSQDILDDGLQTLGHSYGFKFKVINRSGFRFDISSLYGQLVGSLMYLVNTRLDIFFAMNTLS